MKKIKSVKLKREYRDTSHIMAGGQYGIRWFDEEEKKTFWKFVTQRTNYSFCESTITGNKTDLFEIEYEAERKYIDVRIESCGGSQVMFLNGIENALRDKYYNTDIKVTELPEVFSREEVLSLFIGYTCIPPCEVDNYMNDVISERKSK